MGLPYVYHIFVEGPRASSARVFVSVVLKMKMCLAGWWVDVDRGNVSTQSEDCKLKVLLYPVRPYFR